MMFIPVFTLNLNLKILPGRVTIGEYDGQHPCLTAATTGEKVFIHNPHQRLGAASGRWFGGGSGGGRMEASQGSQEVTMLNVNQRVTAVAAGNMDPLRSSHDTLLIGTPTNLLAYDVERNADLFYKEVADGVNVLAVGRVGDSPDVLALVGGNCSLQGKCVRTDVIVVRFKRSVPGRSDSRVSICAVLPPAKGSTARATTRSGPSPGTTCPPWP